LLYAKGAETNFSKPFAPCAVVMIGNLQGVAQGANGEIREKELGYG
jgi:hypothetical protein